MWTYIIHNKEWIFSGFGIAVLSIIVGITRWIINKKKSKETQVFQNSDNSTNVKIETHISENTLSVSDVKTIATGVFYENFHFLRF